MPVKVSVVVPVYNPGPYIEDCVASLLNQSLPADAYELIFVDDGSTDGTPARLDELAAQHAHVRVLHQENSGWSGRPRNVGIDAARGEFVMFVDNDDHLGPEALERMYDYGVANKADVIVGKMAGKGRPVPVELFRRNRPHATVDNAPLIDSLTPHKMLRRSFLDRTGLRFPEGRRRLEDHVFVTEAYLRADNVSVLSDYVCYYHVKRDDAANAGFQRFDPVGYYKNLREALDVVERYTEPGPLRDKLMRRWLRVEMADRMSGRRLLAMPDDYRRELFREIHAVVVERFGPGVAAGLRPGQRIVAALLREDRYDDLVAFAEWEAGVRPRSVPTAVEWQDGTLRIGLTAEYVTADGPLTVAADAPRPAADGAPRDAAEAAVWLGAAAADGFERATADLILRDRATAASFFQPVELTRERIPAEDGGTRLVLRATAGVDPGTAAGGAPLHGGLWDMFVRVSLGGWTKECRLGPAPEQAPALPPAGIVAGRVVLPYWTKQGRNLSLDVDRAVKSLGLHRLTPADAAVSDTETLTVALPLYVPDSTAATLRFTATASGRTLDRPAVLTPADGVHSLLEASIPLRELRNAVWRTGLGLPDGRVPALALLLRVGRGRGDVEVVRPGRPGPLRRLVRVARRALRSALGRTSTGKA
ncbi:Glycosyltransferase involved in cell wall bisynthesis [Streptomyces sp. 1222.5]|uniref:glycosyltransferase family 2 protein n=1 Tax=unclassified Streptomyces TaxID=2593676 RepID=UPI00089D9A8D|nr:MULTISPECIES: glycosyltransferase [unclassified Streptomyces]PKW11653.1 glycosyltransferase involved in cell wall biosynthesis [Streptomyces sp. 5112.2]SEB73303.1 Glycosyltransferase involved in cell wall bisynthesis [Streptomyces sp. 1222.5]